MNKPRVKLTALMISAMLTGLVATGAQAVHYEQSLEGSEFEIDTDANLELDDPGLTLDWAELTGDPADPLDDDPKYASRDDKPTGSNDDSFKGGTKEDTENPATTTGSIPNNKSDLLKFGVFQEGVKFLHLYWARVQNPSGTTLMDFEFNQNTPPNTGFPGRTAGDLLVEYKLAQGGITPELFLYRWLEDAGDGVCEASNSYPCWGEQVDLTGAGIASGSVNMSSTSAVSIGLGDLDPYTFGEASIDLSQVFPEGQCQSLGSAYLKSRSSDSFSSQMKDFIAPVPVSISNCATITIVKQDDADPPNALPGADFALYFAKENVSPLEPDLNNPVKDDNGVALTCTTSSTAGTCSFDNLLVDDYCVVETKAPTGYSLPNPDYKCVSLIADKDETLQFENPRKPAKVVITKKDDASPANTLGAGWIFTLYADANGDGKLNNGEDSTPASATNNPCTTDTNGTCTISDILPPGKYCVDETTNGDPTKYGDTVPQCFELTLDDEENLSFVNPRLRGDILLKKTRKHAASGSGDHPHAGVTFTLFDTKGTADTSDDIQLQQAATDSSGLICFTNLLLSDFVDGYRIEETVPTGYVADGAKSKPVSVTKSELCSEKGGAADVSFANTPLTDVQIKVDSLVDGGTKSKVTCKDSGGTIVASGEAEDFTVNLPNLLPDTYTCEIYVDP